MIERVQRSRKKGAKLPSNTLVVTRPTIWGNPWEGQDAVAAYKMFVEQVIDGVLCVQTIESALRVKRIFEKPIDEWKDLRSRMFVFDRHQITFRVACWCPVDAKCHGDVIRALPYYLAWNRFAGER